MKDEGGGPAVKSEANGFASWGVLLALALCFGASLYAAWQVRKLSERADDLFFQQTSNEYSHSNDLLTADVGSIQFMRRGYSITFDTINYTASGLEVTGTLGNPTLMTLTSITLKLTARGWLYNNRKKVLDDPFFIYVGNSDIGSGQTTINYLGAGKTAVFSMTIPNVKQTKDGFQIVAQFLNERYAY